MASTVFQDFSRKVTNTVENEKTDVDVYDYYDLYLLKVISEEWGTRLSFGIELLDETLEHVRQVCDVRLFIQSHMPINLFVATDRVSARCVTKCPNKCFQSPHARSASPLTVTTHTKETFWCQIAYFTGN